MCIIYYNNVCTLAFIIFLSQSDLFDLLTVGVEGYCCTWSHSMINTYTRQNSSGPVISPTQRLPDNTQHSQETDSHAPPPHHSGIRTRNPSKREAADLPLTPRAALIIRHENIIFALYYIRSVWIWLIFCNCFVNCRIIGGEIHLTLNVRFNFLYSSTNKPTNALYFLSMSTNPTYVSAAIEPSSGVQGHVHFNIH